MNDIRTHRITVPEPANDVEPVWDIDTHARPRSPKGARIILWSVLIIIVSATVWANQAELDEVVIGSGKVIPSRQIQVVQNLEGGILAEILVQEGDTVQEGQVLLRIDDTRFSASYRENKLRATALAAKATRLKAEAEGRDFADDAEIAREYSNIWENENSLFASRRHEFRTTLSIYRQQIAQHELELAELGAKLDKLENGYALANKELRLTVPLVKEGAVSEVEVIRLQRQVNDIRGEVETTKLAIPRIRSKHREAQEKLTEFELSFRNKARKELNEVTTELAGLDESNVALEDRVERTAVRSPVKGTVKQLLVHTVGGVIKPGMNLIEIVPIEDSLLVEAQILPANIAFLRPGQNAIVKLTAYDFSIYGGLPARLEHISADSILDKDGNSHYLVRVRTDKNYLGDDEQKLPIIPGMTTYVDILTGKKTVLSYILKPLLRAKERALRER